MRRYLVVLAVLSFCASVAAKADTVYFSYTGTSSNGATDTLSFTLSSPAYPFQVEDPDDFSVFISSPGSIDGLPIDNAVGIFNASGGLFVDGVTDESVLPLDHFTASLQTGPSLFTGSLYSPTFQLGMYDLSGFIQLQDLNSGNIVDRDTAGVLTISATPPALMPEPSSLLLLGTGVLGVGGMVRRRDGAR